MAKQPTTATPEIEKDKLETLLQSVSAHLILEIKDGASKREKARLAKIFTRLGRQYGGLPA